MQAAAARARRTPRSGRVQDVVQHLPGRPPCRRCAAGPPAGCAPRATPCDAASCHRVVVKLASMQAQRGTLSPTDRCRAGSPCMAAAGCRWAARVEARDAQPDEGLQQLLVRQQGAGAAGLDEPPRVVRLQAVLAHTRAAERRAPVCAGSWQQRGPLSPSSTGKRTQAACQGRAGPRPAAA